MMRRCTTGRAAALVLAATVVCGFGTAAAAHADVGATTPQKNTAYIFDALGAHPASTRAEDQITEWLHQDGYLTTLWRDPTEGTDLLNDHHGVTLDDFVSMAGAGVIIINGHGSGSNGVPVETYPSTPTGRAAQTAAENHLLQDEHWSPAWIREGVGPYGAASSIGLTPAGIDHFFAGKHTGLVFSSGCGTGSLGSFFHAQAFFGYTGETCSTDKAAAGDMRLFFERLAGFRGTDQRTTRSAFRAGGFSSGAAINGGSGPSLRGGVPLTLAPAVTRVTPDNGSTIGDGRTAISVHFDTAMDRHGGPGVVKIVHKAGCVYAALDHERWRTPQILDVVLVNVMGLSNGCTIELRVRQAAAQADPDAGWPAPLDGNQSPSPENGAAPNRSDYDWKLRLHVRKVPGGGEFPG